MNKRILVVLIMVVFGIICVSCNSEVSVTSPTQTVEITQTPTEVPTVTPTQVPTKTNTPTEVPTSTPSPTPTQELPFPKEGGNEVWQWFDDLSQALSREIDVTLVFEFDECTSSGYPNELVVYNDSAGCWKISNIEALGMRDENRDTEEMDYVSAMVFTKSLYKKIDGTPKDCRKSTPWVSTCIGPYFKLEFAPPGDWADYTNVMGELTHDAIPSNKLGFNKGAVEKVFEFWQIENPSGYSKDSIVGIVGLDRRTSTFLSVYYEVWTGYFDPWMNEWCEGCNSTSPPPTESFK